MLNTEQKKTRKKNTDAAYYRANREEIIERVRQHQRENRESKNRNNRRWQKNNKTTMNAAVKSWRQRNPEANMIYGARERAKKMGIECDLKVTDIVIPSHCPVFGFPLTRGDGKKQDNSPSLDRIDNEQGYTKENIIVVSWLANRIKSNATLDQLKAIVAFYEDQAQKISSANL